jgi:uncharacterized protein YciI
MPFMIETWDGPGRAALRDGTRPAHIRYLDANKHKILACGAKLADDGESAHGTVYLLDTDDRAEAERFLADDPFTIAGLPERTFITRWRKGFFNFANTIPGASQGT